jgi:hypothetical protein
MVTALIVVDTSGERSLGRLTHTVETLCTRANGGLTELFVTDGDGGSSSRSALRSAGCCA